MTVHSPGGISAVFLTHVDPFAPAIFRNGSAGDQNGLAAVVRVKNNELVTFTNPIHPDETIVIYLAGLSQTSPPVPLGDASPVSPLATVSTLPSVKLGNEQ